MAREQPPVTIVDPTAASPRAGERLERRGGAVPPGLVTRAVRTWRRWPAQVAAVGATLSLLGGILGALDVQRRERGLDEATIQDVALALSLATEWSELETGLPLQLVHLGTRPVRVLSIAVLPSSPALDLRGVLLPTGGALDVVVPDARPCPESAGGAGPTTLLVRVETERGDVVGREIRLAPAADSMVSNAEAGRCGLVSPELAVTAEVTSARYARGVLAVKVRLRNSSRLPVSLFNVGGGDGLFAQSRQVLPLTLPADTHPPAREVGTPTVTALEVLVRVYDCRILGSALRGFGSTSLVLSVRNGLGEASAVVELRDAPAAPGLAQLAARCAR